MGSNYKELLIEALLSEYGGASARVLDLGCGTSANFVAALHRHQNISYTGVEQDAHRLSQARAAIGHLANVELHGAFGEAFRGGDYDLVMSLSVVEHVKRLDAFLSASVHAAKRGGRILHRYDLGHALSPSTPGERLRVAVARRLPALVPKARFTTYPDRDAIVRRLGELGVRQIEIVQAQMPSLKAAVNLIDKDSLEGQALCAQMVALDAAVWRHLETRVEPELRDRLFPAVMIAGYRAN